MNIYNFIRSLPIWFIYSYLFVLGACIGSFLNVVIYRFPIILNNNYKKYINEYLEEQHIKLVFNDINNKFSLSFPSSTCPSCGHKIKWFENIPIISWLFLRGACSSCKSKISIRYLGIELLTGLCFVGLFLKIGFNFSYIPYVFALCFLISLFFIDYDELILPDEINYLLLWLGLASAMLGWIPITLKSSLMGVFVGYACMSGTYWLGVLLFKKEGIGFGDFKLFAALGSWIGPKLIMISFFLSSIVGLIFGLLYLKTLSKSKTSRFHLVQVLLWPLLYVFYMAN